LTSSAVPTPASGDRKTQRLVERGAVGVSTVLSNSGKSLRAFRVSTTSSKARASGAGSAVASAALASCFSRCANGYRRRRHGRGPSCLGAFCRSCDDAVSILHGHRPPVGIDPGQLCRIGDLDRGQPRPGNCPSCAGRYPTSYHRSRTVVGYNLVPLTRWRRTFGGSPKKGRAWRLTVGDASLLSGYRRL
jgi:hypothetical protein